MFKKYRECVFDGKPCFVRREAGARIVIMTTDGLWAQQQGGWEQVDKFEWERNVDREEIQFLSDELPN